MSRQRSSYSQYDDYGAWMPPITNDRRDRSYSSRFPTFSGHSVRSDYKYNEVPRNGTNERRVSSHGQQYHDHIGKVRRREIIEYVVDGDRGGRRDRRRNRPHRPKPDIVLSSSRRGRRNKPQSKTVVIETRYITVPAKEEKKKRRGRDTKNGGGTANKTISKTRKMSKKPKGSSDKENEPPEEPKRRGKKRPKPEPITEAQLNAELEDYMKSSKHPRITI
uniref:FoP_duplication domain-containing protein n=1 Tax=Panagrellus redivivus TaxID=6233 RepID=A0A7E5A1V2_PANRE